MQRAHTSLGQHAAALEAAEAAKSRSLEVLLAKQRLVLSAIKDLMGGDDAPVHAIDSIETKPL